MNRWMGRWLIGVAALHTLFALVVFRPQLTEIVGAGVFDSVGQDAMRAAVVWFVLCGATLLLLGLVVDALEKAAIRIPALVGVCLLLLTGLGVVLMPRSGFWLLFPPALFVIYRAVTRGLGGHQP